MKHSDYLKKKKNRETRKKIISVISAIVVFITTYALVLPAITLDVSRASREPGIAYEQMQFKATASAASVTAADSTVEEVQVEEPAAEEAAEEETIKEEAAEIPEEETSAVSDENEKEEAEQVVEEAPAESAREEAPAAEAEEVQEEEDKSAEEKADAEPSSEPAREEAQTAETQKSADQAAVDQSGKSGAQATEAAAAASKEETAAEFQIPTLDPIDFDEILTGKTDFYFYHIEKTKEDENITSDSVDDWKKVGSDTVLAPEDFVRVYLSYEIPAGSLNETNAEARYRLPAGLELSDKQIKDINKYENGIAASKSGSEHDKYLGAEAIEGSRTPNEKAGDEYISATVKAEKVYKDGEYIGQDLIFTFIPYTVEKNQISYDEAGKLASEGRNVKGFFTFDLTTAQIEFEKTEKETVEKEDGTTEETQYSKAEVVFVKENNKKNIDEISRTLTLAAPVEKEEPKTLTSEGSDYTVTVSYTADAQIPDNAELAVREIEKDTDEYASYLEQAKGAVDENKSVNEARFFDITIVADGEKIEPQAPVNVQITFTGIEQTNTDDTQLLHYKDDKEVEVMDQAEFSKSEEPENETKAVDTVQFETDGFSVYGIVGTGSLTTKYITAKGETYTITVTYEKEAEIPEGSVLEVKEIVNGDNKYADYIEQAAKAMADGEDLPFVNAARLFDISIMADGKKVEPKAPVEVKIEYTNAESLNETSEVGAVHFKESLLRTETEVLDVTVQGTEGQMDGVTFKADAFSIYAVVIIDKEEGSFVFEDEKYKVTITYTKEANIPIGTELTVKEITDDKEYDSLWSQTVEKMNEGVKWENEDDPDPRKGITDAVFFDISLIHGDKEIEPDVPLDVDIELKEGGVLLLEEEEAKIVHFAKNETEIIDELSIVKDEEEIPAGNLINKVEYVQSGFSPVGLITTGEYIEIKTIDGPLRALAAANLRAASSIAASKTVTDPDKDGIFELALSVTGSSESSSTTEVNKSNVVLVLDTSDSMVTNYTYSTYTYSADTYSDETTYYRRGSSGNYSTVWYWPGGNYGYSYHAAGWYRGTYGQFNNTHSGTVYTRRTRFAAEQDALYDLVGALLANNDPSREGLSDIVEISIVSFDHLGVDQVAHNSDKNAGYTTNEEELDAIIAGLETGHGTNWEQALLQAQKEVNWYKENQADEAVSVILLTDGEPTQHGTTQTSYTGTADNWPSASVAARALVDSGATFYGIFTYGTTTSSNYLKSLVNYAYGNNVAYDDSSTTQYTRDYFFDAQDTEALKDAFQAIINNINNVVGYGGVDYEDGVTVGVTNTSVTVDGTVHDDAFRYTVRSGNTIVYTVSISDNVATFNINGTTYTDSTPETVTTVIDPNDHTKDIVSTVYSVEVGDKTYKMSPATINKDTGLVDWDLAGLGILENGYTYTVAFDVWPNQYSYDLVADLNNKVKTLEQIRSELIEEHGEEEGTYLYDQIVASLKGPDEEGQYAILTNWKQEVNYYTVDTETNEQTGETTTTYTPQPPKVLDNPEPVALTSKPLPMVKIWDSNLSPDQIGNLLYEDYPINSEPTEYRVTLHLWKADTASELQNLIDQYAGNPTTASQYDYLEKTLGWNGTAYDWDDTASIAPGTMVSLETAQDMGIDVTSSEHQKNIVTYGGDQYYIVEKGHYYYITEDNIDWHFELETIVYHPMLVNGRLKNVTFITDEDGNITGVEDVVDMTQVTATNSKTAELDITKKVVDNTGNMTQEQMDAETFTYKITLTVPADADMSHTNALEWVARYNDDPTASNRYYVFGYQSSEDASVLGLDDDVERFDNKVYGQYTVSYPGGGATLDEIFTSDPGGTTKSGTIYVTLKQNEIIRFTNLPSETQYRIEEMYNNLYQADPSRDADANLGNDAPESNVEENGYSVTIVPKNGEPTVSGRVVSGKIDKLNKRYYNQFTNTLNDTAVVDLNVTKHLQGYEWTGERYNMKLAAADENTPLPRITTRYLSAESGSDDVTFNFGSVHLKPGTYIYTISEMDNSFENVYSGTIVDGITYDSVKTIKVTVSDDLSISVEGSSDGVTYDSQTNTVKTIVTNKVNTLSIYKFGGSELSDIENKLTGVQFKLYSDKDLTQQVTQDARGNAIGTNGLITTGADGTANLGVLNAGKYYLVETGLGNNDGYNKLTDAVEIEIGNIIHYKQTGWSPSEQYNSASNVEALVKSNGGMYINYAEDGVTISGYTFTINNNTGYLLPNTGGFGTLPYTLGGLMLLMASALMYGFRLRRRERRFN